MPADGKSPLVITRDPNQGTGSDQADRSSGMLRSASVNKTYDADKARLVTFARQIISRRVLVYSSQSVSDDPFYSTGGLESRSQELPVIAAALIVIGIHHDGEDLSCREPILEFALEIHPDPIHRWLKGEVSIDQFKTWLERAYAHSIQVSEAISNSTVDT
jgi:hypothetical protein